MDLHDLTVLGISGLSLMATVILGIRVDIRQRRAEERTARADQRAEAEAARSARSLALAEAERLRRQQAERLARAEREVAEHAWGLLRRAHDAAEQTNSASSLLEITFSLSNDVDFAAARLLVQQRLATLRGNRLTIGVNRVEPWLADAAGLGPERWLS